MSEGGVSRYIKTSVDIYFPEGHMACNLSNKAAVYSRYKVITEPHFVLCGTGEDDIVAEKCGVRVTMRSERAVAEVGDLVCGCPLLETYSRNQCRRTGEYLMDTRIIGAHCPLEIIDEEEEF